MRNDDDGYTESLERALAAAEKEIKGLEDEIRRKDETIADMADQLAPMKMGEPAAVVNLDDLEKMRFGLENCRLLAAKHRDKAWALLILGFCAEAGFAGNPMRGVDVNWANIKMDISE